MKTLLRKVKWNKGVVEGKNQPYDYTRIYVDIPVFDKQEKEFGRDVLELEFGSEADAEKLKHLRGKLPIEVEVEFMPLKKGNSEVNVVTDFKVIGKLENLQSTSK